MMSDWAAPRTVEENETGKSKKLVQTPRRALGDKKNSVLTEEKIAPLAYSTTKKGLRPARYDATPVKKSQILVFEDEMGAEESVVSAKDIDGTEEAKEEVNEESWMDREEIETFGRAPFVADRDATILANTTTLIEPSNTRESDLCEVEEEEEVVDDDWDDTTAEFATCDHDHGHRYDDVVACYPFELENVVLCESVIDVV